MSTNTTTISDDCASMSDNLVVQTWSGSGTGALLADENWYGFFY
jgi:hypothetical protein